MRTYQVFLMCRDMQYAESLCLAIDREAGGRLQAIGVSSPEALNTLAAIRLPDILLTDMPVNQELKDPAYPVAALTTGTDGDGIFMYQSVRGIVREILLRLENRGNTSRPSGCIAVFSPLGRCGKTTLARAVARSEAAGGALYIGMEEYSPLKVHSEILYGIKQRAPDILETVAAEITSEAGFPCIHLSGMYPDFRDVQASDLVWFSQRLLKAGDYRLLVYDIGSAALGDPGQLLAFEQIYLPVLQDPVSVAKLEGFRRCLSEMGSAGLWQRMIPVEIPGEVCETGDPDQVMRYVAAKRW